MKRMDCNNSRWKAANQSKDWRIKRRRRRRSRCKWVENGGEEKREM